MRGFFIRCAQSAHHVQNLHMGREGLDGFPMLLTSILRVLAFGDDQIFFDSFVGSWSWFWIL